MPEENKQEKRTINMTESELQAFVLSAVSAATHESNKSLVDAIIESRKPYIDPAQKANESFTRDQMRAIAQRERDNKAAEQATCEHKQGSNQLSEWSNEGGSFAMHQLDSGELIGVCTNCQKIISWQNAEDRPFFKGKSGNKISKAGQRMFANPEAAIRARTESVKHALPAEHFAAKQPKEAPPDIVAPAENIEDQLVGII